MHGYRMFVKANKTTYIQLLAVLLALQELAVVQVVAALHLGLQPGLDALVLVVEVGQVGHQVLHHVHVRQRVDLGGLAALVDVAQASQGVLAVDVHRAAATDALAARSAECQSRVLLVLNLDQCIQNHRPALVQVDRVSGHIRLLLLLGVPPVDLEIPARRIKRCQITITHDRQDSQTILDVGLLRAGDLQVRLARKRSGDLDDEINSAS